MEYRAPANSRFIRARPLPTRATTVAQAQAGSALPLLAASPAYIHSTGVFGVWSVPDRSTPFKKAIEEGLDAVLAFYEKQVDSRHWYGFWQFGDFMHSYSAPRHVWHYDWGGHAWDNTELGTPLWLWYSFLRTGRGDVFRLAEALHTQHQRDESSIRLDQWPDWARVTMWSSGVAVRRKLASARPPTGDLTIT